MIKSHFFHILKYERNVVFLEKKIAIIGGDLRIVKLIRNACKRWLEGLYL